MTSLLTHGNAFFYDFGPFSDIPSTIVCPHG